jgi:hypothetical protein
MHRKQAAKATARHLRPADANQLEPAGRPLAKRSDEPGADGIARWLTGQEKDPS